MMANEKTKLWVWLWVALSMGCGDASGGTADPCVAKIGQPCVCADRTPGTWRCVNGQSFCSCAQETTGQQPKPADASVGGNIAPPTAGSRPPPAGAAGVPSTEASGSGAAGTPAIVPDNAPDNAMDAGQPDGNVQPPTTGTAGTPGNDTPPPAPPPATGVGPNQTLPPVTDYAAPGPFQTTTVRNTGPDGTYTMFRPTVLGENGFLHSPLTWGNGITTTPDTYPILLSTVASHGFVVIASNSTAVSAALMTAGLDWLIQQNDNPSSEFYGKLDPSRSITMGYSLGGGAALGSAAHPNVITTISMHPAPGFPSAHAPVLLFTGSADTICAPALVDMHYNALTVPTFYANLQGATHLEPVLTGGRELAPSIAWLRLHVYNDDGARVFFYGNDCLLCVPPWTYQTKNWQ